MNRKAQKSGRARAFSLAAFAAVIILLHASPSQAQWVSNGNNINNTNPGNVGIGTAAPEQSLHVVGTEVLSTGSGSGFKFRDRGSNSAVDDWVWYSTGNVARFWRAGPGDLLGITTTGNFGIGTGDPLTKLDVVGAANIWAGSRFATPNGFMAPGSLTIGNIGANFGGGSNWTGNTAGLMLETAANTEIVVHDSGTRLASLMNYEGDGANRITIGRDMGWGALGTIALNGNVGIGTSAPAHRLDVLGAINASGGLCLAGDCRSSWGEMGGGWTSSGARANLANAAANIWAGGQYAVPQGFMAPGSLTIGNTGANFGGGGSWNANTAALMLETAANTEIVVHDSGTRLASLMNYEGDGANRITIGRDMGWGALGTVALNGNVGIGTSDPQGRLDLRLGGAGTWDRFIVNTTSQWGDGATQYVTIGAGGATGIMISNPHVPWYPTNNAAALRLGRSGGVSTGAWYEVGTGAGDSFFIAKNGERANSQLFINPSGQVGIGTSAPAAKLHVAGDVVVDGNLSAKYQDVAEWVPSTQKLAPGTVVALDTARANHVVASATSYDTRVAGVISAQPGLALGERGEGKVLVATTGRVKIKVNAANAPIRIGDLLVTSDVSGMAMKSEPIAVGGRQLHAPGTIIGKALESLEKGMGEILVLLSLQ